MFTRYMMAAVVASLGAVLLLIMWTPFGPTGPIGQAISVLVIACCAAMATMWSTRWPRRRQSVVFIVVSNAGIAATCLLVYTTPGMSLLGCTAFAALAGYVAFFHTSRYLALVLTTATATSIACAVQLAASESVLARWPRC